MGSSLISVDEESRTLMSRLYNETKLLLESMTSAMQAVEDVLNERESITKADVKQEIDAVL
jgi:ATP-dependent Zn protease